MAKATIKDVAKKAGVSIGAVSRFLSGSLVLPDETGQRIRDAVEALKYTPHSNARRLRHGKSETIGFVAPEISNPFFALLASAIGASAWSRGYDLSVWSTNDLVEREVAAVNRLHSSHIDGLILSSHNKAEPKLIEALKDAGPIVIVDEDVLGVEASRVFVDNEHGAWLATKTLIDMGHTKIAHVAPPGHLMSSEQRKRGWERAMKDAGLCIPDNYYVPGPLNETSGRSALIHLLEHPEPPTAVFVGSDPVAFGLIAASHQMGFKIPEQLSVISFDGLPVGRLLDPSLTTVAQPIREMGEKSVDLLLRRIRDPEMAPEKLVLPVALEMRASAAPYRNR